MRRWGMGLLLLGLVGVASTAHADRPSDQFQTITKTATATTAQTDTTLWDPAAGKRIILMGCVISAKFAQTVELEVANVDVVPPIYFESFGIRTIGTGDSPVYVGATDAVLTYSTSSAGHSPQAPTTSIVCWGYEWKG